MWSVVRKKKSVTVRCTYCCIAGWLEVMVWRWRLRFKGQTGSGLLAVERVVTPIPYEIEQYIDSCLLLIPQVIISLPSPPTSARISGSSTAILKALPSQKNDHLDTSQTSSTRQY